jgi:hypothetical protein
VGNHKLVVLKVHGMLCNLRAQLCLVQRLLLDESSSLVAASGIALACCRALGMLDGTCYTAL